MGLCRGCVAEDVRSALPSCALCRGQLQSLGLSQVVTPFWQRLPGVLAYGLKPSCLLFIAGFALLGLLNVLSPLLGLLVWAVALRYLVAVADDSAEGESQPPTFVSGLLQGDNRIFIKQFVVVLLFASVSYAAATQLSALAGLALAAFFLSVFPASTQLLIATRSLREALNPFSIAHLIRGIGWAYAVLSIVVCAFAFLAGASAHLLTAQLTLALAAPISMAVALYLAVAAFHLLGYALYQYQHQLGFSGGAMSAAPVSDTHPADSAHESRSAVAFAERQIEQGRYPEALRSLNAALREDGNNLEAHETRFRLLLALRQGEAAQQQMEAWLTVVQGQRPTRKLQQCARALLLQYPQYRPPTAALTLGLAEVLHHARDARGALRLLLNMHQRYPDFNGIPKAYFLAARILSERLKDDTQALRLLGFIEKHYPQAKERQEIAEYHALLRKLT